MFSVDVSYSSRTVDCFGRCCAQWSIPPPLPAPPLSVTPRVTEIPILISYGTSDCAHGEDEALTKAPPMRFDLQPIGRLVSSVGDTDLWQSTCCFSWATRLGDPLGQVLSAVLSAGDELEAQEMLESFVQLADVSPLFFRTTVVSTDYP